MQVWMKGDFTRVRWQGCWIGEHDRDGDTLYLGDQGPGSVSIDSNTKDIWETYLISGGWAGLEMGFPITMIKFSFYKISC